MTEWDDGLCPVRFSMRGGGLKRRKLAVKGVADGATRMDVARVIVALWGQYERLAGKRVTEKAPRCDMQRFDGR